MSTDPRCSKQIRAALPRAAFWVVVSVLAATAAAAQTRPSAAPTSVEINEPDRQLGLIWSSSVVPGMELLLVKNTSTRYGVTFYTRYQLVGVVGNSLQITESGATQDKSAKTARESAGMTRTLFVERANDGVFYFEPSELKDVGILTVSRSTQEPSRYTVSFVRRKR